MKDEQWKAIPGWPGYEVSDLGRVRSKDRFIKDKNGKVRRCPGKGLERQTLPSGYVYVWLSKDGRRYSRTVHSLVALAFIGLRPGCEIVGHHYCTGKCRGSWHVRHRNGDGSDNRAVNLDYQTPSENMRDAVFHKTHHNAGKTHCKRGHRLWGKNLREAGIKQGKRICRACASATATAYREPMTEEEIQELADERYANRMSGLAA